MGRALLCPRVPARKLWCCRCCSIISNARRAACGCSIAFLVSCVLLMVMSWMVLFYPGLSLKHGGDVERGIFVKNYIDQSQEFALCAVVLGLSHHHAAAGQEESGRRCC